MKPVLLLGLLVLSAFAGCNDDISIKGLLGTYDVMITANGQSDHDFLAIVPGSGNTVVLSFTAGISTDANSSDATGLRASVDEGNVFNVAKQPAHIEHSTGELDGLLSGNGKVTGAGMLTLTLHYFPMHFALVADGGKPVDAGAGGPELDYMVSGSRQQ